MCRRNIFLVSKTLQKYYTKVNIYLYKPKYYGTLEFSCERILRTVKQLFVEFKTFIHNPFVYLNWAYRDNNSIFPSL